MKLITLSNSTYKGKERILIQFDYDTTLKNIVKTKLHAFWSQTLRGWHLPNSTENINAILATLSAYNIQNNLRKVKQSKFDFTKEQRNFLNGFYKYLKGKRYSKSTIDTYIFFIADFIHYYRKKPFESLTNRNIELYIEDVFIKKRYSISTQRQFISAIKQLVLFCPKSSIENLALTRPKKSKKLPTVLSREEVIDIIRSTYNLKHRTILTLLYSAGLRISELINLKIDDINIDRQQILIKNAKGRKDRVVILAKSSIPLLLNYLSSYKPKVFFIEGSISTRYSASSIRKFLRSSCIKAKIQKRVTPHTLRHSFATHLLEDGISLRHIQELLGHAKPETTMIYTKVSKKDLLDIKSPLDTIVFNLKKDTNNEQKVFLSGNYKG